MAARSKSSPKSEGQRLLLELDASIAEIAETVGCSKAIVSYWRAGRKVPADATRASLETAYAIPRLAWDVEAGGEVPAAKPDAPEDDGIEDAGEADALELSKARLRALHRQLQRAGLTGSARAKIEDTYAKQLALRARLERDHAINLDAFLRGPEWARVKEALFAALKPYPEAAKAAAEALQGLDG